ncbi:MAG TPA: hypothetical protein VD995_25425 [Azospirillum sp.]|nr:hypothetical protein [Azospirillum sp.]
MRPNPRGCSAEALQITNHHVQQVLVAMAFRKTLPVGLRLLPEAKAALEKAAEEDDWSLSSMMERIIKRWLVEHDYLPKKERG